MDDFVLLGHDCPYGRYPAPVIPIGRLNGILVAVYPIGTGGLVADPIEEQAEYVRHNADLSRKLAGFDSCSHRLFASAPDDVEYYPASREQELFGKLLNDLNFHTADRRFRLMFARKA